MSIISVDIMKTIDEREKQRTAKEKQTKTERSNSGVKRGNWFQIFRIEKAFGIWKAWIYPLRKCLATRIGVSGTGFLWRHKG